MTDTNLVRFRAAVAGALAHLESRRQEVNDLNVFPVADGDTGDNMALTLRAVLDELDRLQGSDAGRTIDEIGREEIVKSVARAALLGARGNSGVILSQLIRGAAEELVSRPGQLIDATLIGAALANAADRAYSSVRNPAEGTMLTVAREMAHRVASALAHMDETRLGPDASDEQQDELAADVIERALQAGQDSVARAALLGARGNSGVILSQILRGIADVTAPAAADCGGELPHMDAALLGAALQRGVELVISSMGGQEVSGTIVSVLRAAADAVDECATDGLAAAITAAGDAAVVALEKTPEQLDVLADAGAVDAGGRGLLVLLDALGSTVSGQAPARTVYELSPRAQPAAAAPERPAPQFEVMYGLDGCDAAAADLLRQRLEELGESVAIAAAQSDSYSVHVHTDDAGAAVEAGLGAGRLSRIVISALSSGVVGLPAGSWTRERAVLAVVDGDAAAELFSGEGACVLQRGSDASDTGT
ncbi:MAG TPA: DAK2 domain-containing protein, partial [Solirubrobacteraceae bacterium]|nr:DAK2 domain-containing protein [Solirubrobacteraceae bacterium]